MHPVVGEPGDGRGTDVGAPQVPQDAARHLGVRARQRWDVRGGRTRAAPRRGGPVTGDGRSTRAGQRGVDPVAATVEHKRRDVDERPAGIEHRPVDENAGAVGCRERDPELRPAIAVAAQRRQHHRGAAATGQAVGDRAGHHRVRGDLDEDAVPVGGGSGEGVGEPDGAAQVGAPVGGVERGRRARGVPERAVEADLRPAWAEAGELRGKLVEQRVDLRRVGGDVDGDRVGRDTAGGPVREEFTDPVGGSGDDRRSRRGQHGHRDLPVRAARGEIGLDRLPIKFDGRHCPGSGDAGEQPRPPADHPGTVGDAQRARDDGRRDLPHGVPDHRGRPHAVRPPQRREPQLHGEQHRLDAVAAHQLLTGAQRGKDREPRLRPDQRVDLGDRRGERRLHDQQVATYSGPLRPLPREHPDRVPRRARDGGTRHHVRRGTPGGERAQARDQLLPGGRDHPEPAASRGAPAGQRVGDIAHRADGRVGAGGQPVGQAGGGSRQHFGRAGRNEDDVRAARPRHDAGRLLVGGGLRRLRDDSVGVEPKEDTAATRAGARTGQSTSAVGTKNRDGTSAIAGFHSWKCRFAGICACCRQSTVLSRLVTPEAGSRWPRFVFTDPRAQRWVPAP